MKNQIKLSIVDTKYESNGKTYVKCILTCNLVDYGTNVKQRLPKFVGEAVLKDNDKFDYQIGSKIALAKAERNAYKSISKILEKEFTTLFKYLTALDKFIDKSDKIVNHNTEYIKKLANKGNI